LNKQSGDVTVNSALWGVSPGFEANDLGFQTGGDIAGAHAVIRWSKPNPDRWTRSRYMWIGKWWTWNYARRLQGNGLNLSAGFTTMNYWSFWFNTGKGWRTQNDRLTRGGPAAAGAAGGFVATGVNSDSRKVISLNSNFSYGWNESGGWDWSGYLGADLKPLSSLTVSTGPSIDRSRGSYQYVTSVIDPTAAHTYGSRYVFADIDQFQISMTTRVNWILSPKISLQLYMQPLISVGDYWDFKEFARPGALDFFRYGIDIGRIRKDEDGSYLVEPDNEGIGTSFSFRDPDFNFKSLRLNAVFRWEWNPGSTLFVVWTQNRQDFSNPGTFSPGRDIGNLFTAPADDVFLVRLAYWISR
jgi:hypothetical protein